MEGLSGLDTLDVIKDYDKVIIIDAIQTGDEPGTIYNLSLEDFKDKQTLHPFSTHLNMDLSTMLEFGGKLFP